MDLGGLESESDYPYTGRQSDCKVDRGRMAAHIDKAYYIKNEENICNYLAEHGPIAIAIDASYLKDYRSGIARPAGCSKSQLNHGVLLTAYGNENGTPFWTLKNSWGSEWGDNGFFRLYRGDNTCGVAEYATSSDIN